MKNIIESDYKPIPDHYSDDLKMVVKLLMAKNPKDRPTIKELLSKESLKKYIDSKEYKVKNKLQISTNYDDETDEIIINDNSKYNNINKMISPYNVKKMNNPKSTQSQVIKLLLFFFK